jgi:murein L,D-transpeptidase YafK
MPEIGDNSQNPPASKRRRFGISLLLIAIGALAIAGVSLVFAPLWLPRLLSDDTLIHYERTQRRLRAEFGLPLPGQPDLTRVSQRLAESGLKKGAPILVRIYKREFQLELWMQRDGVFHHFATYPICRWSGDLGPKLQQGDSQAPEGFYTVDASALNPNSRWYRSFNLGYPNAFDRDKGRTGSLIMVHGGCASIGCFAMTNAQMAEIWQLVTAALTAGQKRFQVQVYPFRMSDQAMTRHAGNSDIAFWRDLKTGSDLFESNRVPPKVSVCRGRYHFEKGSPGADGDTAIETRCDDGARKG